MYLLQFLMALVAGTSLGCAAASDVMRPEADTCTVLACGTPGRDGLPGRDGAKGEKGDQGTFQNQVDALENKILALQAQFNNYKNGLTVGQKTFFSTRRRDTFANGRALCAKAEATMACPKNAAENAAVHELTKRDSTSAFLDITDIQTEGRFVYANGALLSYTNWKGGEPNDRDKIEDCATILAENGQWNDVNCDRKFLIICEF